MEQTNKPYYLKSSAIYVKEVSINNIEDILVLIAQYNFSYAYFYVNYNNEAIFGRYENSKLVFKEKRNFDFQLLHMFRIFDSEKELLIFRNNVSFAVRFRQDGEGESNEVIDTQNIIYGTQSNPLENNFTYLSENRGIEIVLPVKISLTDKSSERVKFQIRYYLGSNNLFQTEYIDFRFVKFLGVQNESL